MMRHDEPYRVGLDAGSFRGRAVDGIGRAPGGRAVSGGA